MLDALLSLLDSKAHAGATSMITLVPAQHEPTCLTYNVRDLGCSKPTSIDATSGLHKDSLNSLHP